MSFFGKDIAIALVDDAFIFCEKKQEEPFVIPVYVAIETQSERVLAIGEEAKAMLNATPPNITVRRVMANGIPGDVNTTRTVLLHGLKKIMGARLYFNKPRLIVTTRSFPANTFLLRLVLEGDFRSLYFMEIGMATAIGMKLEVQEPEFKAVFQLYDDWFDFSLISLAGIVAQAEGPIGWRSLVEDIQNHCILAQHFRPDAAAVEANLFASGVRPDGAAEVNGWEAWTGRMETGRHLAGALSPEDITTGLTPSLVRIVERIKQCIRSLTPEQQSGLQHVIIHACGSGMTIPGLPQLFANHLGLPVAPFDFPIPPSIYGTKQIIDELPYLRRMKK